MTQTVEPLEPTAVIPPEVQALYDLYLPRVLQGVSNHVKWTVLTGQAFVEAKAAISAHSARYWDGFVSQVPLSKTTVDKYLVVGQPEISAWYLETLEDEEFAAKLSGSPYTLSEFARLPANKRRQAIESAPGCGAGDARKVVRDILYPKPAPRTSPPPPPPPVVSPDADPDLVKAKAQEDHHGKGDFLGPQGGAQDGGDQEQSEQPVPDQIADKIAKAVGGQPEPDQADQQEKLSPRDRAAQALAELTDDEAVAIMAIRFEQLPPEQRMAFLQVTGCMDMFRSKLFGRRQRAAG